MRPSIRKWLFAAMGIVVLFVASQRVAPVNEMRDAYELSAPPLPKTVRPSMLLNPLLAVGRAPLVDYLWLRATQLKDQKRFFDAYQLAKMICELQPRFASVWAFQAWNMAYNISVTLQSPEERWTWVRNGYELLRDQGIPLNPNNTQLYRELAWIFFHKVGDYMDEQHWYYKLQFALQMEDILGEPPADFVQPGRVRGDFYRNYDYKALAEAPATIEQLLAQNGVSAFVDQLKPFGFDATSPGVYLTLLKNLSKGGEIQIPGAPASEQENQRVALAKVMNDPETLAAREAIARFWHAKRLLEEVRLDPKRLVMLHDEYKVSFDWRLPEAHALYWANLGMEKGFEKQANVDVHRLNTNRIEFYAMQKMFFRGRMAMSPRADLGEPPLLMPDLRLIEPLYNAFIEDSKVYLEREKTGKPVSENFKPGFVGFLRTAILRYYEAGRVDEAKEKFEYLRKAYPDSMYQKGFDGFLAAQFLFDREIDNLEVTLARLRSLIRDAVLKMCYDEDDVAMQSIHRARQIYDRFNDRALSERMQIQPSFTELIQQAVSEANWNAMPRGAYERICAKLGIEPIPQKKAPAIPPAP